MSLLHRLGSRLLRPLPGATARRLADTWRDLDRLDEADAALVSFPKSGRTFVRVMLARLYQRQFGIDERALLPFAMLRRAPPGVPRLLLTHDGGAMRAPSAMRVNQAAYRGRKVAVLVRHPGDIIVSRHFHLKYRSTDRTRQRQGRLPLEDFVWIRKGGIPSIVKFLNNWAELARQRDGILLVRYEDFISDPEPTLARLARFIGLESGEEAIKEAVAFARFDNLKKLEREGYFTSPRLGAGREGGEGSYKVRSGRSGGYRGQLSEEARARVDAYVARHLDPVFGY